MKFISIEGMDGAGKTVQTLKLEEYLTSLSHKVYQCHFPQYAKETGRLIREYLDGNLRTSNVYTASSMYALDRAFWSESMEFQNWEYVLTDRYIGSNIIHQMALLPECAWEDYVDWLFQLEYGRLNVRPPDITIALIVPPDLIQEHLGNRDALDIIERDAERNSKSHKIIRWTEKYLGWKLVECLPGESIEQVHQKIVQVLEEAKFLPISITN